MKLAILGADPTTVELARAAVASGLHTVDWVCEIEPDSPSASELRSVARMARPADQWESFLDLTLIDAVIVGRASDEDRRIEQLRKLIQVGMPVIVSHPVADSMLIYYELDMIRRESGAIVLPYLPGRLHPAIQQLAQLANAPDSPLGKPEQLVMERLLGDRGRDQVLGQFSRDVDLIRAVVGEISRIGAMGSTTEQSSLANLGVQMSGPGGILARWSVGPTSGGPSARVTLSGSSQSAALNVPAAGAWTLAMGGASAGHEEYAAWDPGRAALDELAGAIAGKQAKPDWVDACRDVELSETIERSLRKGRNVDLHYEEYTEEGTFKGLMTSLGCGLLMGGLALVVAVALVENVARALKRPIPLVDRWPYLLVGLLGVFLLMQLFTLLFARDEPKDRPDRSPPNP